MGQEFKMSQEYLEEFDPEKFAAEIKARAAEQSAEEGVDKQ